MLYCASAARRCWGLARRNSSKPARAVPTEPRRSAACAASYSSSGSPRLRRRRRPAPGRRGGFLLPAALLLRPRWSICRRRSLSCAWFGAAQLLDLHQLPLDGQQAVGQVAPQAHVLVAQRVQHGLRAARRACGRASPDAARCCAMSSRSSSMSCLVATQAAASGQQRRRQERARVHRSSSGTTVTCPPMMPNSARRLRAHASSSSPSTSGRSLPKLTVVKRSGSTP